ncbi:hypothetical protein CN902_26425 [Priestia megaterium]|uniref:hypothetical protein n=1 Tax=Priestia megaterium TaxID=1404 RepID=UPI000BFC6D41|nr:hypothetical protein [Priestia megaterium]PGK22442.1 hypothetical protein CN902_26425 [Priestia megaterium]
MDIRIFSMKEELNGGICYLCESTLEDYLDGLEENYKEYSIQRGIISNTYLDNLATSVLKSKHIPPITLVTNRDVKLKKGQTNKSEITSFRILDGLQRTHRLKILWDSVRFLENLLATEATNKLSSMDSYELTKMFSDDFDRIGTSGKEFHSLIRHFFENEQGSIKSLKSKFKVVQWFEIWKNLSPEDEIDKILLLNAGHKQMSLHHQLELLFLNQLDLFEELSEKENNNFKIIREREMSSTVYSKKREPGMYYFPHLISLTLSFLEGKPVTTNVNLIKKIHNENTQWSTKDIVNYFFIESLMEFLVEFDVLLNNRYGEEGVKWISKDTVITGIFAAFGKYMHSKNNSDTRELFKHIIFNLRNSDIDILQISRFNAIRMSVNLSSINIGSYTKNAVHEAISDALRYDFSQPIIWEHYFSRGVKQ